MTTSERIMWNSIRTNGTSATLAHGQIPPNRGFVLPSAVSFTADQAESIVTNVIIGVVSTVVAAIIISSSAWGIKRMKRNAIIHGIEDFHAQRREVST